MDERQRCWVRELLRLQHNSIRWRHECIIDWWGLPQQSCCIHCRRTIEGERRNLHSLPPGSRPGADLGCGTGRITAHRDSLGVEAFGIDLSPAMVNLARLTHPDLRFNVGSITDLDLSDAAVGGVLAWYSTIHTPPQDLPSVFAEFSRVLRSEEHTSELQSLRHLV